MSNKPLQSIKFPGLGDTYTIVDIENFASAYSTSSTYSVGEYVTYEGEFYRCITDISTAEAWTPSHWSQVTVGEELSDYKAKINHKQDAPETAGTVGQILALAMINNKLVPVWITPADCDVTDVQINGSSIVDAQGVAEIPIASSSEYGLMQIGSGLTKNGDKVTTAPAGSTHIKTGTAQNLPLVPYRQHESAFYGLAKAASDTTQSASSNPVGTYTDAAKIAIQKMLGIYEAPWELIRRDTFTNATEADYEITVDGNGNSFELTDVFLMFETPVQETYSAKSGQVRLTINNSASSIRHEPGGWTQAANTVSHGIFVVAKQHGGFVESYHATQTNAGNSEYLRYEYYGGDAFYGRNDVGGNFLVSDMYPNGVCFTSVLLQKVTGTGRYSLYGKRKWS